MKSTGSRVMPSAVGRNDRDAIVRITSTAICGSDLHLYVGCVPTMKRGDILGHEFMGEVVETGRRVENLKAGDRVVVPFPIACGNCWACRHELYSVCENSNPNYGLAEKVFGHGARRPVGDRERSTRACRSPMRRSPCSAPG